ncbi:MAG: transaldolase family protein, partial [Anaerolineales bacterium]
RRRLGRRLVRHQALAARGAQLQRPLWASTSTKNPAYSDVRYIDELIGPDTVNTMPPHTLQAFKDHGLVRLSVAEGVEAARTGLAQLAAAGIDMDAVTAQLEDEGVATFFKSFENLLAVIERRRQQFARANDASRP